MTKLSEAKIHTSEVTRDSQEKRVWADILSQNVIWSLGKCIKRMTNVRDEEACSVVKFKIEIAELEKKFQAEIKDLKKEADNRAQNGCGKIC